MDIIPPIFIYIIIAMDWMNYFGFSVSISLMRQLQAIATFFMWFKFLYFLRIFKPTGYLIRMIFTVIYDIRYFFLLLFITLVAFGNSMLTISMGNAYEVDEKGEPVKPFINGYFDCIMFVYRMILGDFDTTDFGVVAVPLMWVLFIMCTLFCMIVMLNLLISIIAATFSNVNAVSD